MQLPQEWQPRRLLSLEQHEDHRKTMFLYAAVERLVVVHDLRANALSANGQDEGRRLGAISIRRRNDKQPLRTSGDCLGSDVPQCVVDCDGGGVTIEKLPSGDGLSLRLDEGGIAFGGDCDTKTGVWVKPGANNNVFQLEAVPLEVCQSLEKAQIDPWP